MKYRINVLRRAWSDADEIYEWLAKRSPAGANRWYAAILEAAKGLKDTAESRTLAPESDLFDCEIRQQLFRTRQGRTYRLVFTIAGDKVRILRVRGPGQRPLRGEDL